MELNMKLQSVFATLLVAASVNVFGQSTLYKKLDHYCSSLSQEFDQISSERKEKLNQLADDLARTSMNKGEKVTVLFASHSNSGSSQVAQAWLQVAADRYALRNIQINSVGEDVKAIDKSTMAVLKNAGFKIESNNTYPMNPRYTVAYTWKSNSLLMFSKNYSNYQIPASGFVTVATESNLAAAPGEISRIELSFSSPDEVISDSQCREVAREMFFLAEKLQSKNLLSHK
jgi:hypothetical protein